MFLTNQKLRQVNLASGIDDLTNPARYSRNPQSFKLRGHYKKKSLEATYRYGITPSRFICSVRLPST